jgi:TRAP-type C4-dicarboxylate transport system substrate-binding protein
VKYLIALLAFFANIVAAQTLTVNQWVPPGHNLAVSIKAWCDSLDKTSSLKCSISPRAISSPADAFESVRNGQADIAVIVQVYTPQRFKSHRFAEFPGMGDTAEATSIALSKVAWKNPTFEKEADGVKVLGYFTHGPGMIFSASKPITKASDLIGLKLRSGGSADNIVKALGVAITDTPMNEAHGLLSSGLVDGVLFPAESVVTFGLHTAVRHATSFPGGLYRSAFAVVMNSWAYNKLSDPNRKAVDALSGEYVAKLFGSNWDIADAKAIETMRATGVKFYTADAKFVEAVKAKTASVR